MKVTQRLLIIKAVNDFYNEDGHDEVARFLLGMSATLNEQETRDASLIRQNLKDEVYIESLGKENSSQTMA